MRFRFQTSGQLLDNVPIITRTIQGLTLKPATPSDAKIFRDAQNNALIQWRRRGRINFHWRDRAGVPVSEESEYYEIEILSGSTVVRSVRVTADMAQPIQWTNISGTGASLITIDTDGSGTIREANALGAPVGLAYSSQHIEGDFVFEFEPLHDGVQLIALPDIFLEPISQGGNDLAGIIAGGSDFTFGPSGVFISVFPFIPYSSGDRIALEYIGRTLKWYKNPVSSNSQPLMTEVIDQTFAPYRIRLHLSNSFNFSGTGIRNPELLRLTTPDWTYTAAMQTADGFTPGNPIHLKIYQVSAQVGRGAPLEVTL